jgi:hypothetical protein
MKKKPPKIPLPEPIELAKLAAILHPHLFATLNIENCADIEAAAAVKVAMKVYVEALLFCQESSSMSLDDLITKFGSMKRQMEQYFAVANEPTKKVVEAQLADALELDPEKDDDPVRQYLAERGLRLKTAQSVLNSIRRQYNSLLEDPGISDRLLDLESVIAKFERGRDSERTYAIPKFMLDNAIEHAKERRKESKRKSWHTRKSREKPAKKTVKKKIQKSSV